MDLKGRSFLTLKDYTPQEIIGLLDLAVPIRKRKNRALHMIHSAVEILR